MPTEDAGRRPVVCVLVKGLGIGGAEKLISEAARHWDRDAFDYRVAYLLPWKDQLVPDLASLDVPVVCLGTPRGMTPMNFPRLRRLMTRWQVDLVHAHLPWAGVLARLCSGARPVVYTEHNLVWTYRPLTRLANRASYARNRAVTAVSGAVADSLVSYPGPDPVVVPNGVTASAPPDARPRVRHELGLADDERLVVHVGNIRPGKGHADLVEAAAILTVQHPEVRIVSIGGEKYPGDLDKLRVRVAEKGLEDRMLFLGRRSDALSFIAAADVYVNPAEFEGLPVTILEAMAMGRPVVATAVGGVSDVVEDGVTGLLVLPHSPPALASAVGGLVEDAARAEELGAQGARIVASQYGLAPMVQAFEHIYRRLLA